MNKEDTISVLKRLNIVGKALPVNYRSLQNKIIYATVRIIMGFPGRSAGKESACNVGDPDSIPGLERSSGERIGYPFQYSCLENPHGQRSLAGYSPWGRNESTRLSN